jgi:RNA polymerase sigma-70 factor (ECF subfamily)
MVTLMDVSVFRSWTYGSFLAGQGGNQASFRRFLKDLRVGGGMLYGKIIAIGDNRRENAFMDTDFEALTISSAQRGEESAWSNLFRWHFEAIYRYCLGLAGGRRELAEEVAQQVFVTAARRINKFKAKNGTFRSWLLGIAKNRFMKLQSKEKTRKRYEGELSSESPKGTKGGWEEVLVYEALAKLPGEYRLVLEAKYLEGLKVSEVAESQGLTVKATESLLSRAREKFGEVYKKMQGHRT